MGLALATVLAYNSSYTGQLGLFRSDPDDKLGPCATNWNGMRTLLCQVRLKGNLVRDALDAVRSTGAMVDAILFAKTLKKRGNGTLAEFRNQESIDALLQMAAQIKIELWTLS